MASAATASNRVILDLNWQGPQKKPCGTLKVQGLKFVLKDPKIVLFAKVPEDMDPSVAQKLAFVSDRRSVIDPSKTRSFSLNISIDCLADLKVNAVFEKIRTRSFADLHTAKTSRGSTIRSEQKDLCIQVDTPKQWEPGQRYALVVNSDYGLDLRAYFVQIGRNSA